MLDRSASSTLDEFVQLLTAETPAIPELHEAMCEYQLAKQDWDNFVYALGAFPTGVSPVDGALIVHELAQRERSTLCKMADALEELYNRNQPQEKFVA